MAAMNNDYQNPGPVQEKKETREVEVRGVGGLVCEVDQIYGVPVIPLVEGAGRQGLWAKLPRPISRATKKRKVC